MNEFFNGPAFQGNWNIDRLRFTHVKTTPIENNIYTDGSSRYVNFQPFGRFLKVKRQKLPDPGIDAVHLACLTSSSKRHRPCLPCRLISPHPSSDPRMADRSTKRKMGWGKSTAVFASVKIWKSTCFLHNLPPKWTLYKICHVFYDIVFFNWCSLIIVHCLIFLL